MHVCELVYELLDPVEGQGENLFRDFIRDEKRMARLFEDFVFNFYRREQNVYPSVKVDRIDWIAKPEDEASAAFLPEMRTDVTLRSGARTIVIDTKYYREAFSVGLGGEKIRAEHLYQVFAYLKNLEARGGADAESEGLLLYPAVGAEFDYGYQLTGHRLRACSVSLDHDWRAIRRRLLELVDCESSG
jgi:5-methylcytosine-specific restriction enzyme subunit McrC